MGAAIQKAHPSAEIQLQPGGRGDFIVTVDGRKLWDKRAMQDQFPQHDQILSQLH